MKLPFIITLCFITGIRSYTSDLEQTYLDYQDQGITITTKKELVTTQLSGTTEEYIMKYNEIEEDNYSSEKNDDNDGDENTAKNWDCSKDEVENKQSLMTVSEMIKKGEQFTSSQQNKSDNTILVLGNAGAGKTTFVQFMAGNNDKLISKETGVNTGRFLIVDGVKIGDSVTESFTIYPEQLPIDSETSYTDTPGFSDTRSEKYEIVATYVMKKYLQGIKNVKILLLVPYTSLEIGSTYKDDFMSLLESTISFIGDIDKYEDSVALIATKVPNMFKIVKNSVVMTPDETIIENVADYLQHVKVSLEYKLILSTELKKTKILQNAIKIVQFLLKKDENSNYKKINIFRQPSEEGALSNMSMLQNGKLSIQKTVSHNINYTRISNNDIGYSLSPKAKNYLNCLLWYINDHISKISSYLFQLMKNHYQSKMQQLTDIYTSRILLEEDVKKLKTLKSALKESHNYKNYTSIVQNFITTENIQTNVIDNETFYEIHDHINSLELFTDTGLILSTLEWAEQMKKLINYMKDNLSWCKFQIKLFDNLSSYEIQKLKTKYFNNTDSKQIESSPKNILFSNFDYMLKKDHNLHLNLLTANNDKNIDINNIVTLTMLKQNNISCDNDGKLTVIGYFIKLSEINSNEFVTKYCIGTPLKAIGLYAIHTIFIDGDLKEDCFRGVDVMMVAPKWEIIGKRTINIDGVPGKNHTNSRALDGSNVKIDGTDGRPGFPGGNGGHFVGIGLYFKNEENLIIQSNGGKGGPGQDGGNGKVGTKGKDGEEIFIDYPLDEEKPDFIFSNGTDGTLPKLYTYSPDYSVNIYKKIEIGYCSGDVKIYKQVGICGTSGGDGGDGGVSGLGGYPGKILLISENKTHKITMNSTRGELGEPGKGGDGGKKGENGKSLECYNANIHQRYHNCPYRYDGYYSSYQSATSFDSKSGHFWKCRALNDNIICPKNSASDGISNYTSISLLQPNKPQDYNYDFSEDIYNYILWLKENENDKYLSNYTLNLQNVVQEKIPSMKAQFPKYGLLSKTATSTVSPTPTYKTTSARDYVTEFYSTIGTQSTESNIYEKHFVTDYNTTSTSSSTPSTEQQEHNVYKIDY